MANGIVVDHKETGIRYAILQASFVDELHEFVRDLQPGESVYDFAPKPKAKAKAKDTKLDEPTSGTPEPK